MKFSLVLSLAAGLAAASFRKRSVGVQSFDGEYTLRAADKPANAPDGYETGILFTSSEQKRSTETLYIVPASVERRRESVQALRRLRRQYSPNDFFECANAVRLSPSSALTWQVEADPSSTSIEPGAPERRLRRRRQKRPRYRQ